MLFGEHCTSFPRSFGTAANRAGRTPDLSSALQGGRRGEDRVTDCYFPAGTHHGQVYDPLLQGEDEPRRHEPYRALRKWLSCGSTSLRPVPRGAPPRSQGCNGGRFCGNLPELEKTMPVVKCTCTRSPKDQKQLREEKYRELGDRALTLGVGTPWMIFTSGFISDPEEVTHAMSQVKR